MDDKLRKLHIDFPSWEEGVKEDDFLVSVGKTKSNSVYHIAEVKSIVPQKNKRVNRYYIMVMKTDLITALMRDEDQKLLPITWYSRSKKKK